MKKIGLIAAAGKGRRLGLPFSKELYPIPLCNEYYPVILSNLLALKKIEIKQFVVIINSEKTDILKYLGNGSRWNNKIDYVIIEEPISLPDSLAHGYNLIENKEVYLMMADTSIENNDILINFVKSVDDNYEISLGCFFTDNPGKFATLTLKDGVVGFCEENNPFSQSNIMWGFLRWNPSFSIKLISSLKNTKNQRVEHTMSEIIYEEINNGLVQGIILRNHKYWDLGTYDEINEFINSRMLK